MTSRQERSNRQLTRVRSLRDGWSTKRQEVRTESKFERSRFLGNQPFRNSEGRARKGGAKSRTGAQRAIAARRQLTESTSRNGGAGENRSRTLGERCESVHLVNWSRDGRRGIGRNASFSGQLRALWSTATGPGAVSGVRSGPPLAH